MNIKIFFRLTLMFTVLSYVTSSCRKSYTNGAPAVQKVDVTTYEYLQSKTGVFDSLVKLIDRAGIRSTIDSTGQTVFAFTNYGVRSYFSAQEALPGRVSTNPFTTDSVNIDNFKRYIRRYMFNNLITRDSVATGGRYYYGKVYDSTRFYVYNASLTGDPDFYYYFNSVSYLFFRTVNPSSSGSAVQFQTTDIVTNTGVIQVLPNSYLLFN